MIEPLSASSLRRTFSLDDLHFTSTRQLLAYSGIVGQERAVTALDFGLEMEAHGFNIFVAGPEGIGKMTATLAFLEERVAKRPPPSDWCYVNNFEDPDHPQPIALPAGEGRRFQREMHTIEENLRVEFPKAFEQEEYAKKREEIVKRHSQEREALVETLNRRAREANFLLQSTPYGLMLIPLKEGRPLPEEAFRQLPENEQNAIQEKRRELEGETQQVLKEIYRIEQRILEDLQKLDEQIARYVVGIWIDDLEEKYAHLPDILAFLKAVENDIVANVAILKTPPKQNGEEKREKIPITPPWSDDFPYRKYRVNLLVDHSDRKGAPVIVEENPTYLNLFGRIEKETHLGAIYTDFTMIKSGALHRANGGYLVIPVENLLSSPFSWPALKRALRSRSVRIEEPAELMGFSTVKSLSPDPIPLDLKIILVGPSLYYHLLYRFDADFGELFKVKADFDTRMESTDDNVREFLGFLCAFCEKQGLRHLDRKGVVRLLEFAAREAEDQEKLSTHFGKLSDLLQEADYWARKGNAKLIRASHIERAIREHRFRSGLLQDRIQEAIVRGTYLIDTRGSAVG
ncbi:MAG: ATP-dependent protease, partial [Deltaproteobacteria bacterium]